MCPSTDNHLTVVAPKEAKATIATAGVVGIFATTLFAMKVHLKMSMIATVDFLMIMQQQIVAILFKLYHRRKPGQVQPQLLSPVFLLQPFKN